MKLKTLLLAAALTAGSSSAANAVTYVYVGSWHVGDGPGWTSNPTVYSAREAAALLFGGAPTDYAISTIGTDPNLIDFSAHVDGWGDSTYLYSTVSQDYKLDSGAPGYDDPTGGPSYSAYVLDHSCNNRYDDPSATCAANEPGVNYAFQIGGNGAIPEPATWLTMIAGFGMIGAAMRRHHVTVAA